jgi:hypothetical protein
MMLALFALRAAGADFVEVDRVDSFRGCIIRIGRADATGIQPLRAECHWADAQVEAVRAIIGDWTKYEVLVDSMDDASCVGSDGPRELIWQLVRPGWGLAPREVQVWFTADQLSVAWTTAKERFDPQPGSIRMPRDEGEWRLAHASDGGVDLVQDLLVDPGGSVPRWVVNWFQTFGLSDELKRLHTLAVAVE